MNTKTRKQKKAKSGEAEKNVFSMYLHEINQIPLLDRETENEIARAAAGGDMTARNKLISSNLRFVVSVAKKYQGQGLPLPDLISEGNIGLINAVDRYDVNRGYHFISYAVWWIRQSILKAICEKSRMIRLPLNRANELVRIEHARKYINEQNTEGEIREIAQMLNMDKELVSGLIEISRDMVSLEIPLHSENDISVLGDFIEDQKTPSPVHDAMLKALEQDIEKVLATLNEKEADIIRWRYGLGKRTPMSLKEIGDRFNLTKERIRQIEKSAVTRLKHHTRMRRLQAYVA
jgi:RNA polymerase primary sigma factor